MITTDKEQEKEILEMLDSQRTARENDLKYESE